LELVVLERNAMRRRRFPIITEIANVHVLQRAFFYKVNYKFKLQIVTVKNQVV